jgi:hypothetical protein
MVLISNLGGIRALIIAIGLDADDTIFGIESRRDYIQPSSNPARRRPAWNQGAGSGADALGVAGEACSVTCICPAGDAYPFRNPSSLVRRSIVFTG